LDNPKFSGHGTDARSFCVSAGAAWRGSIPRDFHCQFVAMLLKLPVRLRCCCNCFVLSQRGISGSVAQARDVTLSLGPEVESASGSGYVTTTTVLKIIHLHLKSVNSFGRHNKHAEEEAGQTCSEPCVFRLWVGS
jgi:hypothetical protein